MTSELRRASVDATADADHAPNVLGATVALFAVLLVLIPIIGSRTFYSADEGAGALQVVTLADTGEWALDNPSPTLDPDGRFFPVHLSSATADGYVPIARQPVYWSALSVIWSVLPFQFAIVGLSALGTALAASAAARLSTRIGSGREMLVLWTTGLASPLCFDSQLLMAHAIGAGLVGWSVVYLLGANDGPTSKRSSLAAALCMAGAVSVRTEAALAAFAVAAVVFAVGALWRRRDLAIGAVVVAGFSSCAYVLERLLSARIRGEGAITVAGTNRLGGSGFVSDRIEAFKRTWLWARAGGFEPVDALFVIGLMIVAVGLFLARQSHRSALAGRVAAAGTALVVVRFVLDPNVIAPGLLLAFPLLAFGAVSFGQDQLRDISGVLVAMSALFALAVLATQYRVGGSAEFGGRYFALAVPLIVPVLIAAVAGRLARMPERPQVRLVGAIVVVSLVAIVSGLAGLERSKDRVAALRDTTAAAVAFADAESSTAIVTTQNAVGRLFWDRLDDTPTLLAASDDLDQAVAQLEAAGITRVVLVTATRDDDVETLASWRVRTEASAWPGSRWSVVTFDV